MRTLTAVVVGAGYIGLEVAEALQARGARLLPAADVERGGCLIESDLGQIDASIATRWRQAAAVLGSEVPWQDPEPAPSK